MSDDDPAERCPSCGLPWDLHPYDEQERDRVCHEIILQAVGA
jgi:hypothetical protein